MGDLDRTKSLAGAIRDPWFIVDADRNIRDHNEAFLKLIGGDDPQGRKCYELLELSMCRDDCIALQAIHQGGPARRDDVEGVLAATRDPVVVEGGAAPLTDVEEMPAGALVVYRDVTAAARTREAHEEALDLEASKRQELERTLKERTRELLAAHEDAGRLEDQLAAIRKGTVEPDA